MIPVFIIMLISSIFFTGCERECAYKDLSKMKFETVKQYSENNVPVYRQYRDASCFDSIIYYKTTLEIDGIKHEYLRMDGYRRSALTH